MILRLGVAARNTQVDAIAAALDAGGEPGRLRFYGSPMPWSVDEPVRDQTLIATCTFAFPAGGEAIGGVLAFAPIAEDPSARANGTVTWARAETSDGLAVFDVDVTGPGGGGTVELNSERITRGGPVRVNSFTITAAAG
ncbi:MAG TPA: hypothetical protein VNF04_06685 [Stellaceae bacterium]|nr:hypothetical protein [Stellaceae bacterium]